MNKTTIKVFDNIEEGVKDYLEEKERINKEKVGELFGIPIIIEKDE